MSRILHTPGSPHPGLHNTVVWTGTIPSEVLQSLTASDSSSRHALMLLKQLPLLPSPSPSPPSPSLPLSLSRPSSLLCHSPIHFVAPLNLSDTPSFTHPCCLPLHFEMLARPAHQ
eukprot:357584-Chlamydomonas_euryale.AAC.1